MTTVVCSSTEMIMASDSMMDDCGMKARTRKVFRIRGSLVGIAGDTVIAMRILDALRGGAEPRGISIKQLEGVDLMILEPGGAIYTTNGKGIVEPVRVEGPFYAIGSGNQAAMAAMHMGASVTQSIQIAKKVDTGTGGRIRVYRIRRS